MKNLYRMIAVVLLICSLFNISSCMFSDSFLGDNGSNDCENDSADPPGGADSSGDEQDPADSDGSGAADSISTLAERYQPFELSREKLETALSEALEKIDYAILTLDGKFPSHASTNNVYTAVENTSGWNTGFWTGILWHAYELTGDDSYSTVAADQIDSYYLRIYNKWGVDHHDMGFVYTPSCVAAYKLTDDNVAREAAIMAADNLISRYRENGEFIQAWGSMDNLNNYRLIIDCLMNIPLLFWASEETGDPKYRDIAIKHYETTISVGYRDDGSTYHTYYFDPETGEPLKGVTAQGVSDDSAWARGQAWGAYGPLLTYKYTQDERALELFKQTTNYYLSHLPSDYIAYWDLSFKDGAYEPKDSSSSAIILCAMLEGIKYMSEDDPLREVYVSACNRIMNSLIDNYTTKDIPEANGLLTHATYSKPDNSGVDEMNIWGDYFYMEALHRMLDPEWELYW